MIFGDDIYAISVAMLHKKNAKHLKYFDQDEEEKNDNDKEEAEEVDPENPTLGQNNTTGNDPDEDPEKKKKKAQEKSSFPPIMTFVVICATFTFAVQMCFMIVIMADFRDDNVFYHLDTKGLNV